VLNTLWAASFLFFLCYTAPHRVHHIFEQVPSPSHASAEEDHHNNSDPSRPAANDTDCVFQASANRCNDGLVAAAEPITAFWRNAACVFTLVLEEPYQFLTAPLHSRAPPVV
jgi:hypothetical protein